MALVGDLILELRSRIPDAPAVLGPIFARPPEQTTGGAFSPGATVLYVVTQVNPWGETAVSNEGSVVIQPGMSALLFTLYPSAGVTQLNIYYVQDGASGGEGALQSYDVSIDGPFTFLLTGIKAQSAILPTRSTAFLPDSDGNFIGGYTAYRLLNRALSEMVKIAGGIVDVTGVQTTVNQSMYRLDSPFYTFVNAWYDGYPMDVVPRSFMYLRNSAAGFSGILSYEQDGPQQVVQVWPQSNRTGGSTILAADLDEKANSFQVEDPSGFLSIGLAKIDNEVVVFSSVTDGQFRGVTRGMGGTEIVYHLAGAPVTELNLRMSGYRMARQYNVGDSALTLMVPQSWETPLVLHMLAQVRSMEQDDATAQKLLSDFQAQAEKIAKGSRLGKLKPRQIPIWGQNVSDARNVNGIGFGWLIN